MNQDPSAAIAGLFVGLIFGLAIGVPIAAVLLRAGVSITNRILGASTAVSNLADAEADVATDSTADVLNPFAAPTVRSDAGNGIGPVRGIEEPIFSRACEIVFKQMIIGIVVNFAVGFMGGYGRLNPLILALSGQVLYFLFAVLIYKSMLPTSPGRAVLVYVTQLLLVIAIGVVVVGIYFGVSATTGVM